MKSVLIVGLGRFGQHLCRKMVELGNEVMVIDIDEECVEEMMAIATNAQIGDCTKPEVLKSLGIANFDMCFVCIGTNFQNSLEVTSLLKEYGAKYVVSKATREIHEKFLLRNGADEVVYPERDMARDYAVRYSADHIFDYIGVDDQHSIYEIPVAAEWVGKSLRELDFRDTYKVNILGIKKGEETTLLPMADHKFDREEHLMIIGRIEHVDKLLEKFEHEKGKRNFR
ncbi:MAG: TrkA family potassium uptake protein [Lachnospiraceae bacterium]|nr:TrkA family potassium uptake protein [Lachnospiraceae bacterium]MBQ8597579.1 TrkA family potassium uptake protein [Lachnospiraceae bacterium]